MYFQAGPQTHSVAEESIDLLILLPLTQKCWEPRYVLCPLYAVLGIELRALCMQSKHSAELYPNINHSIYYIF